MVGAGSGWLLRDATATEQLPRGSSPATARAPPKTCDMGRDWLAMSAAKGLPTNSYSCHWGTRDGDRVRGVQSPEGVSPVATPDWYPPVLY
eukprot:COSAG01_NODE_5604_length_4152_cov_2.350851_4_plen_91_part_00